MLAHRLRRSKPAFVLLTISGLGLLFISSGVLVAGCFLIFHENFQQSNGLKEKIKMEFDYSHYWLAGIYLVTSILTLCSACRQSRRRLTFITATFLVFSIGLSLFAMLLDGPDWVEWKNVDRTMKFWENEKDYNCLSINKTCTCRQDGKISQYIKISNIVDCDDVILLTAIYGIIVGGAVVGFSLSLATLFVMVNSISWKNPWKAFASYTASYENKVAMSSHADVIELYRERPTRPQTMESSSTSSIARHHKEYMPAWSLYGSTADDVSTPDPYAINN